MPARGRPPGGQTKAWKEAIWREVCEEYENAETGKKEQKLRAIARRIVEDAMAGDMAAIKEVGDRIDGKSPQQVGVTGADGGPVMLGWLK